MSDLYIINASRHRHKFLLRLESGRLAMLNIPAGGQEVMGDAFDEVSKMRAIQQVEFYGGMEISGPKNATPDGFAGLAYRWERPAPADTIEAAYETDMTRRRKVSARQRVDLAKGFDGVARGKQSITNPGALVTVTEIEEVAPAGETLPSGGITSTIIASIDGGKFEIA
jgi:hypothetical protein